MCVYVSLWKNWILLHVASTMSIRKVLGSIGDHLTPFYSPWLDIFILHAYRFLSNICLCLFDVFVFGLYIYLTYLLCNICICNTDLVVRDKPTSPATCSIDLYMPSSQLYTPLPLSPIPFPVKPYDQLSCNQPLFPHSSIHNDHTN